MNGIMSDYQEYLLLMLKRSLAFRQLVKSNSKKYQLRYRYQLHFGFFVDTYFDQNYLNTRLIPEHMS